MSNDSLLERCKEILQWQKTGILSGTALQNYADSKFSGLVNNLTVAEAATAREAMTELIAVRSSHAAEREALETRVNDLMTQILTLEDSNVKLTKEREALVRKCAEIVESYDPHSVGSCGEVGYSLKAEMKGEILALLSDSGSQG